MAKPKILFVYDHKYPHLWKDGLWAALGELKRSFDLKMWNPRFDGPDYAPFSPDFILGWGAFGGPVDKFLSSIRAEDYNAYDVKRTPIGLCLAGYSSPQTKIDYDVVFYETEWSKKWLESTNHLYPEVNLVHAFGINSKVYNTGDFYDDGPELIWDYLSVGSFSLWKRQRLMLDKKGNRMVIGEIQKENYAESFDIIMDLLVGGVAVSDMVEPKTLAKMYRASKKVFIPAEEIGGGERAVLEARACGVPVEIMYDNKKLFELLTCPIWDEKYYAKQLKKGIMECLKSR